MAPGVDGKLHAIRIHSVIIVMCVCEREKERALGQSKEKMLLLF